MNTPSPDLTAATILLAKLAARGTALTPAQRGIVAAALLTRLGIDNDEAAQDLHPAVVNVAGALARGHAVAAFVRPVLEGVLAQIATGDVSPLIEPELDEPSNLLPFVPTLL